jgi:hypothetical protein
MPQRLSFKVLWIDDRSASVATHFPLRDLTTILHSSLKAFSPRDAKIPVLSYRIGLNRCIHIQEFVTVIRPAVCHPRFAPCRIHKVSGCSFGFQFNLRPLFFQSSTFNVNLQSSIVN